MEPKEIIQTSFGHLLRENPMGEASKDALKLDLDRKLNVLIFRDRFDILLEKRFSGVAELRYIMIYGKSQMERFISP
jgi:hypothetical protein